MVKALTEKAWEDAVQGLGKSEYKRHQVRARVRFILGLEWKYFWKSIATPNWWSSKSTELKIRNSNRPLTETILLDILLLLFIQANFSFQAPVVQTLDSAIHRIKIYLVDNAIGFPNTYPLDSDLSAG